MSIQGARPASPLRQHVPQLVVCLISNMCHCHLNPLACSRVLSVLRLGFGHRCGMCDIGYFFLSGQCKECGSASLVQFLSRAVPAVSIGGLTAFLFYSGASRFACCRLAAFLYIAVPLRLRNFNLRVLCSLFGHPFARRGPFSRYCESLRASRTSYGRSRTRLLFAVSSQGSC